MADPVSAGILAGASILGGITGGKGAAKAAKVQAASQTQALAQQQSQFNTAQANEAPYMAAGGQGLQGLLTLLGLNGGGLQGTAIDALKASPAFTSLYGTGADTILQNAAATGGLRGGNTQNSLAQFGSGLLNQVVQQQLGQYGGLAGLGANAAAGLGSLGQANSNAQSQLYAGIGQSQGNAAAAPYAAAQGIFSQLGGQAAAYSNQSSLQSLLASLGQGGGFNNGGVNGIGGQPAFGLPASGGFTAPNATQYLSSGRI